MEKVLGMILAGGRGKRMDILCYLRPKPALPFAGKLRVIDFSLSNCIHSQVRSIAVLVDYQRNCMADYVGEWAVANAGSARISVLEPESGSYAGTADAVYQNLAYLNGQPGNRVLVLAGDHVYRMDYRKMLAFHEKVGADATVGVVKVPVEEAHRFGTVVVNSKDRIQEFVEKSSRPLSSLASMGIYVFNKDILAKRLVEDAGVEGSLHDFGYAVLPGMVKRDKVFAYEFDGYWQDIGTVEAYYQANMEILVARPRFSLDSDWPVLTDNNALPVPEGSNDGRVVNSLISSGCIIKGRVENSVLSTGVHVEEQAIIRNSVVMANTFVDYHSVVDSCILDEGVQIGRLCYIGFGSSLLSGDSNITVLGKDVMVPPHTAVGRKCKVLPKAGLDDFTANPVPSGTIIRAGAKIVESNI
jgi:glucose-1-phosphate adenylyltransferase